METNSLKSNINRGLTRGFTFFTENPLLTKNVFFAADSSKELKNKMVKQIKENLEAEKKLGYFASHVDMDIVATCLVGSIERLTFNDQLTQRRIRSELADSLVSIYFEGIQK